MAKKYQLFSEWRHWSKYQTFAPLVALLVVALWVQMPIAKELENQTLDWRFKIRAPFDPPADPRIVLLGIDQTALEQFGQWPWPRVDIANFLESLALAQQNPTTVGFDIMFTEESDKFHELSDEASAGDQKLGDSAAQLPSVLTGALTAKTALFPDKAKQETESGLAEAITQPLPHVEGDIMRIHGAPYATLPISALRTKAEIGFVDDEPDPDNGVRYKLPMIVRVGDKIYPSLSLQIIGKILHVDTDRMEVVVGKSITLHNASKKTWVIPITEEGDLFLNYRSETKFTRYSLFAVYDRMVKSIQPQNPVPLPPEFNFNKKALIIGQYATGLTDLGPTPLEAESPLVFTHLNAINNVLKNDYLKFVPWPGIVIGWLILSWVSLAIVGRSTIRIAVILPLFIASFYALISQVMIFWSWDIVTFWPIAAYLVITIGAVVLRWREEQASKQQIKNIFSRMSSPEVVEMLVAHPDGLRLAGSQLPVTVLFSDIRDYTKISEGISEEELVRQLNQYFERMVACVKNRRGRIDKFIGDALMACWSDIPVVSQGVAEDARNAVRSALDMRRNLQELNAERVALGQLPLRIGIGLNHGSVVAGLLGSPDKLEFTVIGDAVNVASRLEGLTKQFHTDLAIGESILELVGNTFLVRRLGLIVLKGKSQATVVYEVLTERNAPHFPTDWTEEQVALYEKAFDDFLVRRFSEAVADFTTFLTHRPNDYCAQIYREAAEDYIANPPPPDWDGRIVMKTK